VVLCYFSIGTVLTVWYYVIFLLELSWECDILLFFIDVGTGLTVWYFVVFHGCWNCPDIVVFCCFSIRIWNCPVSVVFCCFSWMLELFWQCGILLFFMDVGTVLTVWYFVVFLLELSWQCVIMLFFYSILELSWLVFCCFSWMLELFWECGILLFFY
jgi:hypothetical protein